MKMVLFLGNEDEYKKYSPYFQNYEEKQEFIITGIISEKEFICDHSFLRIEEIKQIQYDYIIAATKESYKEKKQQLDKAGILEERVFFASALLIPEFKIQEYMKLKQSNSSIICMNCWGGLTYHYLGYEFYSPFINMFLWENHFLKMLSDLDAFINAPLKFEYSRYEAALKITYPVYSIHGLLLNMNHYSDFDLAREKWEERKKRVNRENLFISMYTTSVETLEQFEKLPYKKKVCFTSIHSDLPSAFYLPYEQLYNQGVPLWHVVNLSALGELNSYNPIKLLNGEYVNGKL